MALHLSLALSLVLSAFKQFASVETLSESAELVLFCAYQDPSHIPVIPLAYHRACCYSYSCYSIYPIFPNHPSIDYPSSRPTIRSRSKQRSANCLIIWISIYLNLSSRHPVINIRAQVLHQRGSFPSLLPPPHRFPGFYSSRVSKTCHVHSLFPPLFDNIDTDQLSLIA